MLLSLGVTASEPATDASPAFLDYGQLVVDTRGRERRDDRDDGRDDRRDCRQEEGRIGDDKRDCKQDERDGDGEA